MNRVVIMSKGLDLNCDLGESEPLNRTRSLMRWISSANVACGGHAGDLSSMEACVRLCKQKGVRLGAHPGLWSRDNFGRGTARIDADELELLLLQQVSALEQIAREQTISLHHIKLHGMLYHLTETNLPLQKRYIKTVKHFWPTARIYARAGGPVVVLARRTGLDVLAEVFLDRAYRDDGMLVPRSEAGALLNEPNAVLRRIQDIIAGRGVVSASGQRLSFRAETLCIHSDTPHAPLLARIAAKYLSQTCR